MYRTDYPVLQYPAVVHTVKAKNSNPHADETNITISVIDKYDSNVYVMNVEVFDAYPFLLSRSDDGSGYMFVGLEDLYIGQIPTVTMKLTPAAPTFTYIAVTWNICSQLTGTCDGLLEESLDVSQSASSWSKKLNIPSVISDSMAREDGSQFKDYYELSITASAGATILFKPY